MIRSLLISLAASAALLAPSSQAQRPTPAAWDKIYLSGDKRVPVNPSALVLETTANLAPGAALDVGMGNGRNAIYLARKGWRVTGIDVSRAALDQAQKEAQKLGATLEARLARFETFDAGRERYDLIVCTYVQALATRQARKLIDALKPGGLLLVEDHHLESPLAHGEGYGDNELLRAFSKLRIVRYEDRVMAAEWTAPGAERGTVVRLVAQKKRS
jgi:SAM-dependent methyltransferase